MLGIYIGLVLEALRWTVGRQSVRIGGGETWLIIV